MHIIRRLMRFLKFFVRKGLPPEVLSKVNFKRRLGYSLNLRNPRSFNEKLQWLKLYYDPNDALVIQCTDKYEVRQYLNEKGLGRCLNTLLGVWDRPAEIVWSDLPEQFAMKCTHGCGYNILCKSKADLDIGTASRQLEEWLARKYGDFLAEPHYNKIKPRIICETYLGEQLVNYKFFCFHGEPKFMYVVQGDGTEKRMTCLDMNQRPLPYKQHFLPVIETQGLLDGFDEMVQICSSLSRPFPFVRVDLYQVGGKILLGELTFTPSAGFECFYPMKYDKEIGAFLSLS